MPSLPFISRMATSEHGFTLMETLVAMVAGVIVTGALFSILDFSLRAQSQITDRAQANQIGRVAMSNIVDELHTSCTGAKPIQEPSTTPTSPLEKTNATNLWLISTYGTTGESSGEPLIKEVYLHDIHWSATVKSNTGKQLGKITDYSFKETAGNSQEGWTFPTLSTAEASGTKGRTRVLANDVILEAGTLFTYSKYNTTSGKLETISSGELPLSSTKAAENVAQIAIGFTQAPESADTRSDRTVPFSDSVLLRLDPTTSEETTVCE